jgi:cation transport regulator ChaC
MSTGDRYLNFAYGSNMSSHRLRARTPSARPLGAARLAGHRLAWGKKGGDGSAKCHLVETGREGDVVWGVLYEIDTAEKRFLDEAEGLGVHYVHRNVRVDTDAGTVEAGAYVAIDTDESLRPFDWYAAFVLAGAIEHGLPAGYVAAIAALPVMIDDDAARRSRNLSILPDR